MPPARWPSFERILEIDKIYTSTTSQIGKLSRVEEHEVEPLSVLPPELMDVIKRKLGCADYFHLRQTSHGNNQAVEDHYCEKIKEAALDAIVQVLGSKSPETINYEFVTSLNDTFLEKLKDGGGIVMHTFGGVQLFDILEIVGYAYPEKLQGEHAFNFSNCSITVEETKGLRRVLCIQGLKVQMVDLSANGLGHEGAEALAHALRDSTSMTSINLSDNNLTDNGRNMTGILAIASAIRDSASLTSISLEWNSLGSEGAKALAPAIRDSASLTSLNLSHSNLAGATAYISRTAVQGPSSNVGDRVIYQGCEMIVSDCIDRYGVTFIKMFNLSGVKALADAIRDSTSLTSIHLLANGFDTEAASMLLKVKEQKPMLRTLCGLTHAETELDYRFQVLKPADAMLLAPEISVMASLTSINLGFNNLGSEGAKAFAPAIRDSPSVTSLNLKDNHFGPEGAEALAPALRNSPSLTSIDLVGNFMGVEGEALLREAVEGRHGIELQL